ncbi:Ca2+-binding RTX toxin-like protein [Microvirga lupini]|uniref:Ca2+-binding RTX toxin-like protein n=1 Tax=Microvirga lupini TaxID=420324 RepID=A0A7W4YXE8_9HYPH|nr:Ig-like domain-containing protein [Microvirga lupini]MBB3018938.1 Ca2+-binding RTX toxin-like protein [Microvirga lupini]
MNFDTLTGGGGLDRFQGTAQTLAGDTITDIQDGETITLLSGTLQAASLTGNILNYTVDGLAYWITVNGAASRISVADNVITFDNTAPFVASINRSNPSPTGSSLVNYTVTFSEGVSGVDASDFTLVTSGLSGAFISQVTGSGSTYTVTVSLGSGNGTAQIRLNSGGTGISDAAGNLIAGGFSAGQVYTVDQLAPETTILSGPPSLSNSSSGTFTFSSNESDVGYQVSFDGSSFVNASSPLSFSGLADGNHTIAIRAVDAAGNVDPSPATYSWTVDTTAPAAPPRPDLDASSDTGRADDDDVTSDTTPTFTGNAEAGATVTLYDGAVVIGSAVATGGTWSITSTPLTDGMHSITARVTDLAGNQSPASPALAVEIKTQATVTEVTGVSFSSDTGASATDLITRVAGQTISGGLSANLAAGERVEVSFDNGSTWTAATAATGDSSWSLNTTLAAGAHTLQVRVTDAINSNGPVGTWNYTLDTVAPSVTINSSASQLQAGETATITFTFTEDPGANFTWDGSAGDVVVTGGTLSAMSGSGLTRTATFTPAAGTNNGTASITVNAGAYADLAGNVGTAGAMPSLHFDTLAPGVPSAPDLAASSDSGNSNSDNLTNNTALTLNGTAESGATIRLYDTDGLTEIGSGVATGGAWSITTSPLAAGSHTLIARVTDAAGNRSPASAGLTVFIDVAAPTLVQTSPADDAVNVAPTANLVLTFSEAVHRGNGTIKLHDSTGAIIESFDAASSSRLAISGNVLTIDPTNPLSTGSGHYYLTASAGVLKDSAGNNFAGIGDGTTFNFSVFLDKPAGPIITPNAKGGVNITITDPSQLTAALGTGEVDHVLYGGSGTVALPGNIENVTFTGGNARARGNALDNTLTGSAGNNLLQGGSGNDRISGRDGDDHLSGGSGQDRLSGGAGRDRLYGGSNNDRVDGGTGNDILAGESGNDTVIGGEGNDRLTGGSGNDVIYGGLGADVIDDNYGRDAIVFNTRLGKGEVDTLTNFNVGPDTIWLENAIFKGVGSRGWLKADAFHIGAKAADKEDRIIYNAKKGMLYYDADGVGGQGQIAFAKLSKHLKMTEKDFLII